MQRVRVSSKHQIVIPAKVRRLLGIKPGDTLLVDVRARHALLMREPESYAEQLAGLHEEVWEGIDPAEYVRAEREAWTA